MPASLMRTSLDALWRLLTICPATCLREIDHARKSLQNKARQVTMAYQDPPSWFNDEMDEIEHQASRALGGPRGVLA